MNKNNKQKNEEKRALNPNKFPDLSEIKLSQDYTELVGVQKALLTVPVRKPNRQEFIRVHPDEGMQIRTMILELKEEREIFLVDRPLWEQMPGELSPRILLLTINRQDVLTLWPIRLPDQNSRLDNWNRTALETAEMAKTKWVRLAANMSLGAYEVYEATGDLPEPVWPEKTFEEIVKTAFKEKIISDLNHPAIDKLLGRS